MTHVTLEVLKRQLAAEIKRLESLGCTVVRQRPSTVDRGVVVLTVVAPSGASSNSK